MKIALFASAFHPSLGGVEELVRQLAHALNRAGHDAFIVTERWPRNLPEKEDFEGLRVYRFPFRVVGGSSPLVKARSITSLALTGGSIRRAIADVIKQENTDIIHVQCVSSNALYALRTARSLDLPFVVTLQGELTMDASQIFQKSGAARDMMRSVLTGADFITGCSGQTVQEAEEFMGAPFGDRGKPIFNGIRLADFEGIAPHSHPRPYILGIGRHVDQKGFDVLLQAYAKMLEKADVPIDLLLAGNGERHEYLKECSQKLGLDGRAHFVGRVNRPEAVALFKGSAFFVLPSRHEPMGIVNLEAMAAGKAVVASRVGGVPEFVINGENGLLVEPGNPQVLADALLDLAQNPQRAAQLGADGAAKVRAFDWDAITTQYLDVYAKAVAHHKQKKQS
ncbi:glycosyltransferase family 1 protein [bacterium]|nr:MAG: glycosyltransferase family 1 protein [bacterium]